MRNGFLVSRMRNLSLHSPPHSPPGARRGMLRRARRPRRPAMGTRNAPLPTWGQIKRLSTMAQNLVTNQGNPLTVENIFLAMLALLSLQSVSGEPSLPSPSSG
ncbi:inteferon-activable protein 208-like [Hylobates moloch]|uniref:inteferon-activable protein 208-like n=1 Tax=Hylobates moloch TaxID=81572 RepID=UPI002675C5F7|nr:inteferon-activable protein 208-like [Hylobates moloch]